MKILQIILMFFITVSTSAQKKYDVSKVSNKTRKIVGKIQRINELMSEGVGVSGMRPGQWNNFEELKKYASVDELLALTNHKNGVVRCYSFWALSYIENIDLFPIVLEHIDDDELVNTMFGCIVSKEKVGDFFIDMVTPGYVDLDSNKMTWEEYQKLDSILVYRDNNLDAKYGAIERIETTPNNYSKIRELYVKDKNQSALVKLAQFNNINDIDLILKNREQVNSEEGGYFYTYKAMSYFPNAKFFPFLKSQLKKTLNNTHYSNEWTQLYRAIASYKNQDAQKQLLIPFTNVEHKHIRVYHLNMIFSALKEFKSSFYDVILWKLWEEENKISSKVFNYLSNINSERAFKLIKKSLQSPNELDFAVDSFDNIEEERSLSEQMLDILLEKDRKFGIQIITENIAKSSVHHFPLYANKASEIKDKLFIKPLLEILEREQNPYIYLAAAEVLISYKDKKINKKILEIKKKNKRLREDWGGTAIEKLLKENNIN